MIYFLASLQIIQLLGLVILYRKKTPIDCLQDVAQDNKYFKKCFDELLLRKVHYKL